MDPDSLPKRPEGKSEECTILRFKFQRRNRPNLRVLWVEERPPRRRRVLAETWNALFPLLLKKQSSLELNEQECMSKLFKLSDYLDLNERFLLVYVMRVCMGRRVRRDYCSRYFNSRSLTLLTSLKI